MRDLHVVALSEDGRHVVLATTPDASRGGFRVALDDRLASAVRGDLGGPGEQEAREQALSVREIQARLRAGESVEEIARSAGVPLARVERFAGPVLSERAQVVEAARRAVLVRGRRGPSALSLGEAVDLRLSELPSMRADSVTWSAAKGDAGRWTVEVSWFSRGRTRKAAWFYDVATRTVTSADPGSAALAHVDPTGKRVPVDHDAAPPTRAARPAATGSTAAAAGPSSPSARPARKAAPRPATARSASTRAGTRGPAARPAAPAARTVPPSTTPRTADGAAAAPARKGTPKPAAASKPSAAPAAPQRVVAGVVRRGAAALVGPDAAGTPTRRAPSPEAALTAEAVERQDALHAAAAEREAAEQERQAEQTRQAEQAAAQEAAAQEASRAAAAQEAARKAAERQAAERDAAAERQAAAVRAAAEKQAAEKQAAEKQAAEQEAGGGAGSRARDRCARDRCSRDRCS